MEEPLNTQRIRRLVTALVATGAAALMAVAGAGAAQAATGLTVTPGSTAYWIAPTPDSMAMSVADASTTPGTRVIQWYNTGGNEQKWYFDGVYDGSGAYLGFLLRNKNSGQCLDTDGAAGDGLFQNYCDPTSRPTQIFNNFPNYDAYGILISWRYQNRQTGLWLDDYGRSLNAGNIIDLWYQNYNDNQDFFLTQTS
jgi:ricin-type beta-trefoil lectin protein